MTSERDDEVPLSQSCTIGIIYNLKNDSTSHLPDDQAEYDTPDTIKAIQYAIESHGFKTKLFEADRDLPQKLMNAGCALMFNIAEGISGRGREAQVPALLNMMGIPYTGSDEITLSIALDKALTSRILKTYRVRSPKQNILDRNKNYQTQGLRFPVIIKPNAEGSGKGIYNYSVVENKNALHKLAKNISTDYGIDFIAEEYIAGREFTVAILGNEDDLQIFPPMEIIFKNRSQNGYNIYGYEVKKDFQHHIEYSCPAKIPDSLSKEMTDTAKKIFKALNCRDYARVDFRCSEDNKAYFIEINPIPGLAPNYSDYPMIASFCKIEYNDLIFKIIRTAAKRCGVNLTGEYNEFMH